ncbi:AraC family transcriptional regulator [Prolixibacter bellariivorans]|uniref:AraC family transcriptional regulator n=1 Tax=Prolixibacter bellariivorans TaxID=314319 RepID=A0A5M4B1J8_9BACT|nr:helix-turn-helix domain-containing protein [Prolixibacter bellariivorans]GET33934.1 AraC family transcriptional regulator [Prolixibacter bellariivorans]
MSEDIIQVKTISTLHSMLGFPAPTHPLISVIDVSKLKITEEMVGTKISADFYYIGLKSAECGSHYGKNDYDFDKGVLAFTAPKQVIAAKSTTDFDQEQGWMLFFHPDLIRGTSLGENIDNYSFFNYDTHEALHLAGSEKQTLKDCVRQITEEYSRGTDNHSQRVLVSCLELLLNYCLRFYERQFEARTVLNRDILIKVENVLKEYMQAGLLEKNGIPTVSYMAEKVNLSQNYLSDLLKRETGRSAKDHITDVIIDKARTRLLGTQDSVAEIAYELGFRYPHYFSRLFKAKTGLTPQEYRKTKAKYSTS